MLSNLFVNVIILLFTDNESGSDSGFESERPPEKRKPGRPRGTRRKKKPGTH